MQQVVEDFVKNCTHKTRELPGYTLLTKDLYRCAAHTDFCSVSSRLLSNYYGTHVDDRLCLAYRRFMLPIVRPEA